MDVERLSSVEKKAVISTYLGQGWGVERVVKRRTKKWEKG